MNFLETLGWWLGWGVLALWLALFVWWAGGGARRVDDTAWHVPEE